MMTEIVAMFQCHVCGSTEAKQAFGNEVFMIAGKRVLVENIPASVCIRCGNVTFNHAMAERILCMLYGKGRPVRAKMIEVFACI